MSNTEWKSPVYNIIAVPFEKIVPNTYNPNAVAPPEMKLLYDSIREDGYTMPIVCYYVKFKDVYVIVDGFHRYRVMKEHKDIYERENGMMPVSVIDKPLSCRMASTVRHNRARGSHDVDLMSNIIRELGYLPLEGTDMMAREDNNIGKLTILVLLPELQQGVAPKFDVHGIHHKAGKPRTLEQFRPLLVGCIRTYLYDVKRLCYQERFGLVVFGYILAILDRFLVYIQQDGAVAIFRHQRIFGRLYHIADFHTHAVVGHTRKCGRKPFSFFGTLRFLVDNKRLLLLFA